jgi:hypothetical protein
MVGQGKKDQAVFQLHFPVTGMSVLHDHDPELTTVLPVPFFIGM